VITITQNKKVLPVFIIQFARISIAPQRRYFNEDHTQKIPSSNRSHRNRNDITKLIRPSTG